MTLVQLAWDSLRSGSFSCQFFGVRMVTDRHRFLFSLLSLNVQNSQVRSVVIML